jgi:heme A synthase
MAAQLGWGVIIVLVVLVLTTGGCLAKHGDAPVVIAMVAVNLALWLVFYALPRQEPEIPNFEPVYDVAGATRIRYLVFVLLGALAAAGAAFMQYSKTIYAVPKEDRVIKKKPVQTS